MKKLAVVLMALAAVAGCKNRNKTQTEAMETVTVTEVVTPAADMHKAQNSLDYAGTYKGTLPCADCEGIEMTIMLDNSGNFTRKMNYLGKGDQNVFEDKGTYEWDSTGSIIEFKDQKDPDMYLVAEGRLIALDQDGKVVTGDLADLYILKKQ